MADRHRSFEVALSEVEPITFDIHGETFHVIAEMPVVLLAEIGTDPRQGLAWALYFMRNVLVREDRDAFEVLLLDPDRPVPAPVFTEICTWILGLLTGNPTVPSLPSSAGSESTGGTSTADSAAVV